MTTTRAALLTLLSLLLLSGAWARRAVHAWNDDSEAIVVATMRYRVTQQHAPPGGLMIVNPGDTVYPSASGLQGRVAGLVAQRLAADYATIQDRPRRYPDAWTEHASALGTAVVALKAASLVLTAAVLALFVLFAAQQWSAAGALVMVVLLSGSYMLAWWATNLYWFTPALFLPFVLAWFLARRMRHGVWSPALLVMGIGAAILLKALAGYEWLSCVLSAASVPFVYYGIRDARPWRETAVRVATVAASGIAATVVALAVHLSQLRQVRGSVAAALSAFSGRAGHWVGAAAPEAGYPLSGIVTAPFMDLELTAFGPLRLKLWLFLVMVPAVAVALALLARRAPAGDRRRALYAAAAALGYALLCSLSWPMLASAHMAAHLHLGIIVFFLPTALMLFAVPAMLLDARRAGAQPR